MNAGLPGTGIGGLFYVASALLMPLHRAARGGGHGGRSWRRVAAQWGIAVGILAALFVTGLVLNGVFASSAETAARGVRAGLDPASPVFRWIALVGTVGLLALVLAAVELLGVLLRRGKPRRRGVWVRRARRLASRARAGRVAAPDLKRVA